MWPLVVAIPERSCLLRKPTAVDTAEETVWFESKHTSSCCCNWSRNPSRYCWTLYNAFWICAWRKSNEHWTYVVDKVLCLQFEILDLHASASHLLVEIWTTIFFFQIFFPMVHITYTPSLIDICVAEWTLRKAKQGNFNENHPLYCLIKFSIHSFRTNSKIIFNIVKEKFHLFDIFLNKY